MKNCEITHDNVCITFAIEWVDAALAENYLSKNIDGLLTNRNIRPAHVAKLKRELRDKNWNPYVNPIIFDKHGRLIDGQHRLTAIKESGDTVAVLVQRGVPSASFTVLDQNVVRNAESFAQITHKKYPREVVPVLRWIENIEYGGRPNVRPPISQRKSEYDLQEEGYTDHPGLVDAVVWVRKNTDKSADMPNKVRTYLFYELSKIDEDLAEHFIRFLGGANVATTFLTLAAARSRINKLCRKQEKPESKKRYIDFHDELLATVIWAWNSVRAGKAQLSKIGKRINPLVPETFEIK